MRYDNHHRLPVTFHAGPAPGAPVARSDHAPTLAMSPHPESTELQRDAADLYLRLLRPLCDSARRMGCGAADAEDFVHDAFPTCWIRIGTDGAAGPRDHLREPEGMLAKMLKDAAQTAVRQDVGRLRRVEGSMRHSAPVCKETMTLPSAPAGTLRCAIHVFPSSPLRTRRRRADTMGMPALSPTYYSVEEVLALPEDGQRYELAYGELLVSPSPTKRHQILVGRIFRLLADYGEQTGAGEALLSPADLTWGRTDVLTQPDVFVLSSEDARVKEWSAVRHLSLAAEVGSPSTIRNDRFSKRRVYQDMRVAVYWMLDPDTRAVDVWTPEAPFPEVQADSLTWHPIPSLPPLVIDLHRLFAE